MFHLMLITDRKRTPGGLETLVRRAVAGGVDIVQIREKDLGAHALLDLARAVIAAAGAVPVLINDRLDVALAAGARGVHLGGASIPVDRARAIAPRGFLIGYSAHTVAEALDAERHGADYVTLSPVFPTASKPGAPAIGPAAIAEAVRRLAIPVVALGGITPENLPAVARAGARRVAVISAIGGAADPESAARRMRAILDAAEGELR